MEIPQHPNLPLFSSAHHQVHDEVKDKMFELELSWVTEATGGRHERVRGADHEEAEKFAKAALEEDSDSDEEDMS